MSTLIAQSQAFLGSVHSPLTLPGAKWSAEMGVPSTSGALRAYNSCWFQPPAAQGGNCLESMGVADQGDCRRVFAGSQQYYEPASECVGRQGRGQKENLPAQ